MRWNANTTTRVYTCRYCGDITEQLSSYSKQADIAYCPNDGTELLIQSGGENMGKTKNGKKMKVMHEIKETKAKHAQEVTVEPKHVEPDPEIERAFEALRKLGGKATGPELVKELGFSGESARDQVRRLMGKLHDGHRIHRTKGDKGYVFEVAEPKAESKATEVAAV